MEGFENEMVAAPQDAAPKPKPAKKKAKPAPRPKVSSMPTMDAFRGSIGSMVTRGSASVDSLLSKAAAGGVAFLVSDSDFEPVGVMLTPEAYEALMAQAQGAR